MTKDEALKHAPEGSTHYTPNGNMFVRVGKSGFVEVCRSGGVEWREIQMTLGGVTWRSCYERVFIRGYTNYWSFRV